MNRLFLISIIAVFLASCATHSPAPVVNRSPQSGKPAPAASKKAGQDWRPDSYKVKKGDTLFSIGLEYGYDYREIAEANNIADPFIINVGQQLNFSSLNTKDTSNEAAPASYETEDGVVISPIKTDDAGSATSSVDASVTESVVTPVLAEPKATREAYSLEALNRNPTETIKVTETTEMATVTPPKNIKSVNVESLHWMWPTPGKVTTKFNAASNKGINIAGSKGQEITATGKGKVIYAGSDLRGYGKLVIVKHNKTFLSVYAHNSKISVKEGQTVKQGQKIAEMGNTDTNTVKLHFEIRRHGKSVDPAKYLPQN